MARETRSHDPSQIILNVGGRDVSGYAAGTFVEFSRNVEAAQLVVGADGESTRARKQDRSGRIKFTLQQSSPLNDYFSQLAAADEAGLPSAVVPVLGKDLNGTTIAQAKKAWVVKKPNAAFSDAVENREWEFETGNLDYTVGGQNTL